VTIRYRKQPATDPAPFVVPEPVTDAARLAALAGLGEARTRLVAARSALDLARDNNNNPLRKSVPVPWGPFFAAVTAMVTAAERVQRAFGTT
jgi:hypothetical protein